VHLRNADHLVTTSEPFLKLFRASELERLRFVLRRNRSGKHYPGKGRTVTRLPASEEILDIRPGVQRLQSSKENNNNMI